MKLIEGLKLAIHLTQVIKAYKVQVMVFRKLKLTLLTVIEQKRLVLASCSKWMVYHVQDYQAG